MGREIAFFWAPNTYRSDDLTNGVANVDLQ